MLGILDRQRQGLSQISALMVYPYPSIDSNATVALRARIVGREKR
jgi:hypothetical protein